MQESVATHLERANDCMRQALRLLESATGSKVKTVTSTVEEALQHVQKASNSSFQQHTRFALSPECFNPFNLTDVGSAYSRFSLHEQSRTVMLVQHVVDRDHDDPKTAADHMKGLIVVYTVSTDFHAKSYVLHGDEALTVYQDDEADLRNTQPDTPPLIANHSVRRHLLSAKTGPPGKLNAESVAYVVQRSLGKRGSESADITVRTWIGLNTKYVLDIVSIWALTQARRRVFEVPGVGDRRDLVEEDPLVKYLGAEEGFDEAW